MLFIACLTPNKSVQEWSHIGLCFGKFWILHSLKVLVQCRFSSEDEWKGEVYALES